MSWSNRNHSVQTFTQYKSDRNAKAKIRARSKPVAAPRAEFQPMRDLGLPLVAEDVPGLVSEVLASGAVIGPGDSFEHLLVVTGLDRYVFMHHFLVAAPLQAGGPQRIVMLTDRTLNMYQNYPSPVEDFTREILSYAQQLDTPPQLLIGSPGVVHTLSFLIQHEFSWMKAMVYEADLCAGEHARFGHNEAVGHALYLEALAAHSVSHPDFEALSTRMRSAQYAPQYGGEGPLVLPQSNQTLGLDGRALCMAYCAGPMSAIEGAAQRCRV